MLTAAIGPTALREAGITTMMRAYPQAIFTRPALLPALSTMVQRLAGRDRRLLVWMDDTPKRWQFGMRLGLACADAILTDSEAAADAMARRGTVARRVFALPGPYDITAFAEAPARRHGDATRRILHLGPLTARSGAMDLLAAVMHWAGRHAAQRAEIVWSGEGALRGVLEAQPMPPNVRQSFFPLCHGEALVALYRRCGLLVVQNCGGDPVEAETAIAQAMASGLVILGAASCRPVMQLVRDGETGWLYDGNEPGALRAALGVCLGADAAALDDMRVAARLRVSAMTAQGFQDRLDRAFATVMRDIPAPPEPRRSLPVTATARLDATHGAA
jgi:glycosyltransferase involved in cell wall biosynthesis